MATHSSVLAWRIPGMGKPGGLLSMESHVSGESEPPTVSYLPSLESLMSQYIRRATRSAVAVPSPVNASSLQCAWRSISGTTLARGFPFFIFAGLSVLPYYFLSLPLLWPSILIIHKSFQKILRELHEGKFWRWEIQGRKIGYWNILGFPSV